MAITKTYQGDQLMQAAQEYIHPFTDTGLGRAPFRFIGVWSYPSQSLLEANPSAYNSEMAQKPDCVHGTCDHCGMPLTHFFMIQNADGKRYSVGSSCIHKAGDGKLVTAAKAAERQRQRKVRQAKAAEKRKAQRIEAERKLEEERRCNGGATLWEVAEAERMNAEHDELLARKAENPDLALFAATLRDGKGGFCDSIARDMDRGYWPEGNAKHITMEILAKLAGRKNSKAYSAEYERLERIFPE